MRKLKPLQKARAAECLSMAYSHHRVGHGFIKSHEFAAAVSRLYYTAFFTARAAAY